MSSKTSTWAIFSQFTKLPIASASALTAAAGYLAAARTAHVPMIWALLGTQLLALASCALNEWQEQKLDSQMQRTAARPLPSGRLSNRAALAIIGILTLGGTLLLLSCGWVPTLLGLLAMAWYNGLYTPLKRWTPFAVVPGSLIGAIPPAIGWTAAGGSISDPGMLALCLVFFLWQVPHFWLLLRRHEQDYARAGFPTLGHRFAPDQTRRILFVWTVSVVCACGLLPAFHVLQTLTASLFLGLGGLGLLVVSLRLLNNREADPARGLFMAINLFALILTAATSLDPFIRITVFS